MNTKPIFCSLLLVATTAAQAEGPPEKYVLDYPQVKQFCPPVRSTFHEVQNSQGMVNGRRFRYQPNGGYGLKVVHKVGDKNLIHVGADLGWRRVGEPVFAVADGVVRVSRGPRLEESEDTEKDADEKRPSRRPSSAAQLEWGNLIVVEHRNDQDEYATTIYGHLDTKRLVQPGDIVTAGQQIGTIGRRHVQVNGNYDPHLHFGVRKGRIAEVGAVLLTTSRDTKEGIVLKALGEEEIELQLPPTMHTPTRLRVGGKDYAIRDRNGTPVAPASLLWHVRPPSFPIIGYALSTDDWRDPVQFLREQQADTNPAPFQPAVGR